MKFEFDHVGVAVENIEEARQFYETLGLQLGGVEEVATEKVKVAMFELANASRVELLEATHPESPIQKFLDKRGAGIHHVCLRVEDIHKTVEKLKANGVRLINEEPRPGAHGCQVVFVHPKSTGGVLLELSQPGVNR